MADYMLMVLEDEDEHASQSPKATAELIDERTQFADELRRAGRLRDSGRFRPSKEGKRVRRAGDELEVRSGPFAEDGKALGGYYCVEAGNIDEAARTAAGCPVLASDEVDVRPWMKGQVDVDKDARPGKLFAFVVLGNAPTDEAWVQIMDRIDVETSGCFPRESFLGGVRLMPPKTGRRVATRGESRATFDGPFLETKEVIGGVFFLRLATIEEAVRWAGESRFVVHGTLEIRELWRT
jgi:hypothetical protein